jgi:hypothetical protein
MRRGIDPGPYRDHVDGLAPDRVEHPFPGRGLHPEAEEAELGGRVEASW